MTTPKVQTAAQLKERVIMLISGDSGAGKSFFIANLKRALIFDTDIGGGLSYADARITRNGSKRIEVGSYLDILDYLNKNRGHLRDFNLLAIDHLSTLHQEGVNRHNPSMKKDFGAGSDKATREWRKIREQVRGGDFHLICTSHLKGRWEDERVVGEQADAAKKIEGDFHIVLHVHNDAGKEMQFPKAARVYKWRRDPEDARGLPPASFRFTVDEFLKIHGHSLDGAREELPMATPDQIERIKQLVGIMQLPEETVQKWRNKAAADTWEEFTADALGKCIAYLEDLLKKSTPAGK